MKENIKAYKDLFILSIFSILIGLIVGVLDTIFGKTLLAITKIRENIFLLLIPFLSIIGVIIVYLYKKYGGKSSKGMGLIFEVYQNKEEKIPLRLIPFVILSTWATHLFGGSAGREGVAVLIGGTFSNFISRKIKIKDVKNILLISGMAAGFSGLFQTPIAAILFALEVLVTGKLFYKALVPAIFSSFIASYTSNLLGLEKFTFNLSLSLNINFNFLTILKIIILGIIFGLVGCGFSICLKFFKKFFSEKFKNPIKRIFLVSIFLTIIFILLHNGRYSGLGTNLINNSFYNETIYYYDWILKFILTIITLSIGFQGGEVTPLFSIGASLGVILSYIFNLPIEFVAAIGYLCVFGSATNVFFAPIFIGCEVFGYNYMPYFFIAMAFSYTFNFNKSIYFLQQKGN